MAAPRAGWRRLLGMGAWSRADGADVVAAAALGGIAAALIDIELAALINRVGLDVVLRAVARGVLGRRAMGGGLPAAALGFGLQLAMGALIGTIYGAGAARLPILRSRWGWSGLAYGAGIFVTMEFIVVPASAVRRVQHFTAFTLPLNVAAMLLFGSIVAFAASRRTVDR